MTSDAKDARERLPGTHTTAAPACAAASFTRLEVVGDIVPARPPHRFVSPLRTAAPYGQPRPPGGWLCWQVSWLAGHCLASDLPGFPVAYGWT